MEELRVYEKMVAAQELIPSSKGFVELEDRFEMVAFGLEQRVCDKLEDLGCKVRQLSGQSHVFVLEIRKLPAEDVRQMHLQFIGLELILFLGYLWIDDWTVCSLFRFLC